MNERTAFELLGLRSRRLLCLALSVVATLFACATLADSGALSDPTAPPPTRVAPGASAHNATDYHLSGIWWRSSHGSAVVNGKTVSSGASVDGAEVVVIGPDFVRLRMANGELTTLRSSPSVVQRGEKSGQNGDLAARE